MFLMCLMIYLSAFFLTQTHLPSKLEGLHVHKFSIIFHSIEHRHPPTLQYEALIEDFLSEQKKGKRLLCVKRRRMDDGTS